MASHTCHIKAHYFNNKTEVSFIDEKIFEQRKYIRQRFRKIFVLFCFPLDQLSIKTDIYFITYYIDTDNWGLKVPDPYEA